MESRLLEKLGYSRLVSPEVLRSVWGEDNAGEESQSSPAECLKRWLNLLPDELVAGIELSKRQGDPFMPPNFTPELFSSPNAKVPSMDQLEIVCRCLDFAMQDKDYEMAAALVFVADRPLYRFGRSKPLLQVVSEIQRASPDTAIAPQVILRQARVMKDEGDLNGVMRVTQSIINKDIKWNYQNDKQYDDIKAASIHVQGQIHHILVLWRKAVTPLVEAIRLFGKIENKLGLGMCQTLLSHCLPRLTEAEYKELRRQHPDIFRSDHPCYEGYLQGLQAVANVQHIDAPFFSAKHQLLADESLLMYAAQKTSDEQQNLLGIIVQGIKKSMAAHRTVQFLNSIESFVEFVRAVFTISLVLSYSSLSCDQNLARLLEKLSMNLYSFMCKRQDGGSTDPKSNTLTQTQKSVNLMNAALRLLGLPDLEGDGSPADDEGDVAAESGQSVEEVQPEATEDKNQPYRQEDPASDENKRNDPCTNPALVDKKVSASDKSVTPGVVDEIDTASVATNGRAGRLAIPAGKASTYPATSAKKSISSGRQSSSARGHQKYVGLAMTLNMLQAVTCPELSVEAEGVVGNEDEYEPAVSHCVDALTVSATYLSTAPSNEGASMGNIRDFSPLDNFPANVSSCTSSQENANEPLYVDQNSNVDFYRGECQNELALNTTEKRQPENDQPQTDTGNEDRNYAPISCGRNQPERTKSSPADPSFIKEQREEKVHTVDLDATTRASSGGSEGSSIGHTDVDRNTNRSSSTPVAAVHEVDRSQTRCSAVDQDATTKTSEFSSSLTSDSGISSMHPLVDTSSSSSLSLMRELQLGEECSVEASSTAEEFLQNWEPGDDDSVHRAVLITFSSETGNWLSQTTLAHIGPQLKTDKKGAFRDAFHISVLHQDDPLGRYVGKRYRRQTPPEMYMIDVWCQMTARYYVTRFNQALSAYPTDILRAEFLPAFHLQLVDKEGKVFNWINVEPYFHGSFLKMTSNHRYVSKGDEVEVATAFSHFSFVETHGRLMVVDLQGWVPSAGCGVIYFTDPVLHTGFGSRITSCDRQQDGMRDFWQHVHPTCNRICRFLNLDKHRPVVA